MELREGYQLTPLGPVPSDWLVLTLKKISPSQSVGLVINPSSYVDSRGTVPMLLGSDIQPNLIDFENSRKITEFSNRLIPASKLNAGDLVMVRVGEPGITAVIPPEIDGCNCASMMIIRRGSNFDSNWLCHVMNSDLGLAQVHGVQYGTAQKQFNISDAINFLYPTPPFFEQKAIATALSDVDALIAGLEKLITKKRDIKQAAMQQLLTGQTRMPGFSGEWETKLLPELADIRSGGTPSTNDLAAWDGDIAWCTPTDISALAGGKYLTDTARRITKHGLNQSSAEVIPVRSIVMTSRATIGECAINVVPMTTNQGFKNFVPYASVDTEFLYYLLVAQKAGFISLCGGSTFLEIGKTQLRGYAVYLPPDRSEQTAVAAILSDMDTELSALESRLVKTRDLKQGMMQELLTGRTRLV